MGTTQPFWSIPREWAGETVVCIGGGASLTQEQVDSVRGRARVIAINDAYRMAPWADLFYFCDYRWLEWHRAGWIPLSGIKVTLENNYVSGVTNIRCIKNRGVTGLWVAPPDGVCTGGNSGYQVVNLAVLMGAKRILLLGYDHKKSKDGRTHWFGDHPNGHNPSAFPEFLKHWPSIVEPLAKLRVEVINVTPDSALEVFPKMSLEEAFRPRPNPDCPLCKGMGFRLDSPIARPAVCYCIPED